MRAWQTLRAWSTDIRQRLPVVEHVIIEATRIDLVDRCLALGAQALLVLLPLVVVLSAWVPPAASLVLMAQVRDTVGLDPTATELLRQFGLNDGTTTTQTGLIGFVVALISATSFSRALQRTFAKIFDLTEERRLRDKLRVSVSWVGVWLLNMTVLACLHRWLDVPVLVWVLAAIVQLGFWWWTAHTMLYGARPWLEVLPVAVVTTAGSLALVAASGLVMPRYTRVSIEQFGGFGAMTAIATWLVAYAGVIVVGAFAGRLISEDPHWPRLVGLIARPKSAA